VDLGRQILRESSHTDENGNLARAVSIDARFQYGFCLANGKGVSMNQEGATRYFRLAADQGLADAQYKYGFCLATGKSVLKNQEEAAKYYQLAADQGLAAAQSDYGICLANGKGVLINQTETVKYYRLAAEQGYATAQLIMEFVWRMVKVFRRIRKKR
jgi:TPR repeat protein